MMLEDDSQNVQQPSVVQHNIRTLLDSNLPAQITQLEESTISLERVAAYCEANYIQSQNKAMALAETKRYALQSLGSVAYLVGELSRSLLHSLELEQVNLAQKTGEIQNISQLVAIQREKAARREIGKLTTAKNLPHQQKITYPTTEERTPRYQRTPIDFSILDEIGHGRRAPANSEYGSIGHMAGAVYTAFNRTNSNNSGQSGSGESAGMLQAPIYEHYARTGSHGTLTRGSIRSAMGSAMHDQYRVPQSIPSTLRSHYSSMQQPMLTPGMEQQPIYQQRYASRTELNGGHPQQNSQNEAVSNNHYDYQQYGTLRAAPAAPRQQSQGQQGQSHYSAGAGHHGNGAATINQHLNPPVQQGSNSANNPMNNSAEYSDDGLPLPPPLLLAASASASSAPQPHQQERFSIGQDDGFPLPPPPLPHVLAATGPHQQQHQNNEPGWMPQQYIEKAQVLYDYESQNPDELRLYQGAVVYVLRKNEDGWFEGVMDGITGLFPGNYVQALSN